MTFLVVGGLIDCVSREDRVDRSGGRANGFGDAVLGCAVPCLDVLVLTFL